MSMGSAVVAHQPQENTMNTTFIATAAANKISAAKLAALNALVRGTRYSISAGDGKKSPAYTLCFEGPREYADPAVIAEFRRITGGAT
jgi:hypothetical protein